MRAPTHIRGFTLIEILIVVVILGILAAIVIPQFTDATEETNETNIRANLRTIRSQIELFNAQRQDLPGPPPAYDSARAAPGDATFWDDLVNNNFLQQAPRNAYLPLPQSTAVGAVPAGVGWVWDAAAEELLATDGVGGLFVE